MPAVASFFSENQTQLTFAAAFPGGYFFAFSNLNAHFSHLKFDGPV
jgi:hypothetical protein